MTVCDYCKHEIKTSIEDDPINVEFVNNSTFNYCSTACAFKMLAQELGASEVSVEDMTSMVVSALEDLDNDITGTIDELLGVN